MSATTSKTGRNVPQTGCFKDQEFRSFKGPLLENILQEKLTVSDSTANGYLALADSYVTKLLQLLRKSQQYDLAYFFACICCISSKHILHKAVWWCVQIPSPFYWELNWDGGEVQPKFSWAILGLGSYHLGCSAWDIQTCLSGCSGSACWKIRRVLPCLEWVSYAERRKEL